MAFLRGWILDVITITIFIVLLEILIPSGKMRKYVNLVSGLILLIVLINPFVKLLGKDIEVKDLYIQNSNAMDRKDISDKSKVLEEQQLEQITEIYRNKIIQQIEAATKQVEGVEEANADVIINEDYTSERFGEIKRIYIYLRPQRGDGEIQAVAKVKKVVIKEDGESPMDSYIEEKIDKRIVAEIENNLRKTLGVDNEVISISLEESWGE